MNIMLQLNKAMDYIEENITNDLALDEVSSITNYSQYHFGRLFYYISDMPLSEYIRKRKLTLAAEELKCSDIKIIDLAIKYGYDSADSFTRAFAKQHGMTPSIMRSSNGISNDYPKLVFQINVQGENK